MPCQTWQAMQRLARLAKGVCSLNMLLDFSASGDQGVLLRISFFATPQWGYCVGILSSCPFTRGWTFSLYYMYNTGLKTYILLGH